MISRALRDRACRALGHEDPAAFGLRTCPLPDDDLVAELLNATRAPYGVREALAHLDDDDAVEELLDHLTPRRTA